MTFQDFLKESLTSKHFGDSPESDFAADAVADKTFRDFKTWDELETYIVFRGACREAVAAAKKCFRQWEASRAKK